MQWCVSKQNSNAPQLPHTPSMPLIFIPSELAHEGVCACVYVCGQVCAHPQPACRRLKHRSKFEMHPPSMPSILIRSKLLTPRNLLASPGGRLDTNRPWPLLYPCAIDTAASLPSPPSPSSPLADDWAMKRGLPLLPPAAVEEGGVEEPTTGTSLLFPLMLVSGPSLRVLLLLPLPRGITKPTLGRPFSSAAPAAARVPAASWAAVAVALAVALAAWLGLVPEAPLLEAAPGPA